MYLKNVLTSAYSMRGFSGVQQGEQTELDVYLKKVLTSAYGMRGFSGVQQGEQTSLISFFFSQAVDRGEMKHCREGSEG